MIAIDMDIRIQIYNDDDDECRVELWDKNTKELIEVGYGENSKEALKEALSYLPEHPINIKKEDYDEEFL